MITFDAFHQAVQDAGCYCWELGDEHVARCPAHQDDNPSMGYRRGTNGAEVVAHCFAGCAFPSMLSALGLPAGPTPVIYKDPPPARRRNGNGGASWRGTPLAIYEYQGANGLPVHRTVKWGKDRRPPFTQEHYAAGRWQPGLNGVRPLLYRLPELLAAGPDQLVFWPEGEKDVETLRAAGFVATTHPMGAESWDKVDLAPLADRRIVPIGDNDDVGRRTATARAHAVLATAAEVTLIPSLPDVPEHGDVTDFLGAFGPEPFLQLVADSPVLTPSPTSWRALDLDPILAGEGPDTVPTMLARTDGACLLYPGKIHAFNGEPEAGKGWLVLVACIERIRAGEHVVYLDFEDIPATAVDRLQALGLEPDDIRTFFHYVRPDEPLAGDAVADLEHQLRRWVPPLCVVDGMTDALILHDFDPNENKDLARFFRQVIRPLTGRGAAVVLLDHVTKDKARRGGFAIGAQHKKARIDVAYEIDNREPFGRGRTGYSTITVRKDRPGCVRGLSAQGRDAGSLRLTAITDGSVVDAELRAPALPGAEPFKPTHLMERVSTFLEPAPEPLSQNIILKGVSGNDTHLRQALAWLVRDQYVEESKGPRGARLYRSLQPYREPTSATSADLGPTSASRGADDFGSSASPRRGGRGEAEVDGHPANLDLGHPDDDDDDNPWD